MYSIRTSPGLLSTSFKSHRHIFGSGGIFIHRSIQPAILRSQKRSTQSDVFQRSFHATYRALNIQPPKPQPKSDFASTTKEKFQLTKSKLLAQASGPLSRLLIHIKWPLKRNNKPFSIDDMSAMFSWVVMGNVLWILLGTTTFGLTLLYSLHTFDSLVNKILAYFNHDNDDNNDNNDQNKKGGKASGPQKDDSILGYLTSSILSHGLGIKIEFEKKGILPEFNDGKLIFKNIRLKSLDNEHSNVSFSCDVQSLSLSLSFGKWSDGHGLIKDLEIFGLNGKVLKKYELHSSSVDTASPFVFRRLHDSIHFQFDMSDQKDVLASPKKPRVDPNYELNSVKIHDSYFEVFDSKTQDEPLKFSIFNCELPKLTGKSLLVDFFNASNVTGSINGSMFTIHKKQDYNARPSENTIRFKLDGIDMGGLAHSNPQSKFNWILNGKAEIVADIRFPSPGVEENSLFKIEYKRFAEIINRVFYDLGTINNKNDEPITKRDDSHDDAKLMKGALQAIYQTFNMDQEDNRQIVSSEFNSEYVFIDAKVKFYNLQATLPKELPLASTGNVPFLNLHDLRSLVSYINKIDTENKPPITMKTMVIEKLEDLYNVEHLTQTRVFDVIVSEIYEEFLKMVKMDEERIISEKSSLWSHSVASQLLLLGLGAIV